MGKYFKTDAHIEHSMNRHFQRTMEWTILVWPRTSQNYNSNNYTNYTIVYYNASSCIPPTYTYLGINYQSPMYHNIILVPNN